MAKEKKETADLTVEERLKALYQLQSLLSEIDKIKTLRGELPLEVKDLEDEVAGLETRIANLDNDIKDINFKIGRHKSDIDLAQGQMKKYQDQQNSVRNNREYDSLTKEIEYSELDNQLNDKKIREAQENIERITREADSYTLLIGDRREDLNLKKKSERL